MAVDAGLAVVAVETVGNGNVAKFAVCNAFQVKIICTFVTNANSALNTMDDI